MTQIHRNGRVLAAIVAATTLSLLAFRGTVEQWRNELSPPAGEGRAVRSTRTADDGRAERGERALAGWQAWMLRYDAELQGCIVGSGALVAIKHLHRGARRLPHDRKVAHVRNDDYDLDAPLIRWSRSDAWTMRDSFAGIFICGGTGSGKTTGSGETIARSFLEAGYGVLVLTAKAEEVGLWRRYCREAGREADLIVFGASEKWRFDPIDFEWNHGGGGAGQTECVVQLLSTLLELAEPKSGQGGGREDEGFWRRASRQLGRNLVDLLSLATGKVNIPDLYRLVVSAPNSPEQVRSDEWRSSSFCFHCLAQADASQKTESRQRDFELVADYFLVEFPGLSEKTRSVVVSTFTSMIDVLNRGLLRELFCSGTNLTPEAIERGKIVVIDLPVKEYAEVGQYAQVLWKYAFQRSIERRDVRKSKRPVVLWADEAQYFATAGDMQFLTTCRAYRVANVYLTQNVNNLYAALGGTPQGKAQADSVLACLSTKIFHANSDPVSNELAATLIGRVRQFFVNASSNNQGDWISDVFGLGRPPQASAGVSEHLEFEVQPATFTSLRTGGPEHGFLVDAIVFQNGKTFNDNGRTWRQVAFTQTP